ncbi:S1C family serine protease [Phenylobacterium sp. VNQ135]|uniref:S1C family serine protease n=1 Tax=Phenylobacterium sp. VNQ135 TaxID=3400922 RepID=UPI003C09819F
MNWVRAAAVTAALSAASYAWAAPPEARLGQSADLAGAGAAKGKANLPQLPASGLRFGKALARLQPEAQATTRGAAETRVYQKASPAVVLIVTEDALGSGALISPDGRIITNLHVVEGAETVGVIFKPAVEGQAVGKSDVRRAKVIRRDELTDLALIQVEEVPAGVTPLAVGNSTTVQVGADVHAIGHPTGEAWTYTRGIVSQVRRAYNWQPKGDVKHEATVIQTQTPLNPGNSGGPLLNDQLEIIGINSFVGDGEGLNYAVSAEDVKSFLARTDDRMIRTKNAASERCESAIVQERATTSPKGIEQLVDTDCDGKGDSIVAVPASKRDPITVWVDGDGDGKLDTMFFDERQDGTFDSALYDNDGDGKPDTRGFFRKGEDEPYRWEKIN